MPLEERAMTSRPALIAALESIASRRVEHDGFDLYGELAAILGDIGFAVEVCRGQISFAGLDPIVSSTVRMGAAAATALVPMMTRVL
jgi:hypothetical protein